MSAEKKFSRFRTEFKVRPDDIDMFNHVHNSKYFDYVLAARYEQMEEFYGMPMEEFLTLGYGWVVKTAYVDYKRPLGLGDFFIVETGIEELHERGCRVTFSLLNKKTSKVCCDGWFDYVLIDKKTGRSAKITGEMLEKYSI
ncbi:acyl-CoA thioesterase [Pararcticibacter amylolyticus]|uniref:Thioesterase n=1 Tax=Pararcticibacter amylolyticus TaxID=2173175 RepID=A0A2U2PLC3_9SPHI|nr:acyl-CoA thioesterase [Pararcticibacter amylolyticus]PWG82205.1 thioesterase [Pararcticibacter amylolyticus]